MGFFGNVASSVAKTALTPVAVVKDAADTVIGKEPSTTKNLVNSAIKDAENAINGED